MGMPMFGKSTLVFDFESAGSTTATSSPTATGRGDAFRAAPPHGAAAAAEVAVAAGTSGEAEKEAVGGGGATGGGAAEAAAVEGDGGGDAQRTAGTASKSVVLVHNRVSVVSVPCLGFRCSAAGRGLSGYGRSSGACYFVERMEFVLLYIQAKANGVHEALRCLVTCPGFITLIWRYYMNSSGSAALVYCAPPWFAC